MNTQDSTAVPTKSTSSSPWTSRRRLAWVTGVVVALQVATGGAVYTLLTPAAFTASSVFSLRPEPETPVSGDVLLITAQEYVAYVSSPQVMAAAAAETEASAEALRDGTDVSVENGTTNVRIDVTLSSAPAAVNAANQLADVAAAEGIDDRLVDVKVVSLAAVTATDVTPPRRLFFAVTGVLSILSGFLVWYVVGRSGGRPTRTSGHDNG